MDILPTPYVYCQISPNNQAARSDAQANLCSSYPALRTTLPRLIELSKAQDCQIAMFPRLEAEHLVLKLANGPRLLVTQTLGRLLERRDHRRRAAHEDLDVGRGSGELRLDHVCRNEAHAAVPLLRRVVEHVVHPELVVLGRNRIDVLLQQDILGVHVGEDQIDFSLVTCCASALDSLDDLQHGGDSGATSNHTEVTDEVGRVDHGTLGAAHLDRLSDLHRSDMLGDVSGGVGLDEEVDVAVVFVGGDGSVRADDFLAVDGGGERDVLADREAEDVGRAGKGKTIAVRCLASLLIFSILVGRSSHGSVVREDGLLGELKLLELGGLKDLARGSYRKLERRPEQAVSGKLLTTVAIHLPPAQYQGQSRRKRQPLLLHEGGADYQQG